MPQVPAMFSTSVKRAYLKIGLVQLPKQLPNDQLAPALRLPFIDHPGHHNDGHHCDKAHVPLLQAVHTLL
jgi:hypothetical protein